MEVCRKWKSLLRRLVKPGVDVKAVLDEEECTDVVLGRDLICVSKQHFPAPNKGIWLGSDKFWRPCEVLPATQEFLQFRSLGRIAAARSRDSMADPRTEAAQEYHGLTTFLMRMPWFVLACAASHESAACNWPAEGVSRAEKTRVLRCELDAILDRWRWLASLRPAYRLNLTYDIERERDPHEGEVFIMRRFLLKTRALSFMHVEPNDVEQLTFEGVARHLLRQGLICDATSGGYKLVDQPSSH